MTQTINLTNLEFSEMTFDELQSTNGGRTTPLWVISSGKAVLYYFWQEFLDGFEDGSGAK